LSFLNPHQNFGVGRDTLYACVHTEHTSGEKMRERGEEESGEDRLVRRVAGLVPDQKCICLWLALLITLLIFMMAWSSECLFQRSSGLKPRGGASIVNLNEYVLVFGGVDREQNHFSDLWLITGF